MLVRYFILFLVTIGLSACSPQNEIWQQSDSSGSVQRKVTLAHQGTFLRLGDVLTCELMTMVPEASQVELLMVSDERFPVFHTERLPDTFCDTGAVQVCWKLLLQVADHGCLQWTSPAVRVGETVLPSLVFPLEIVGPAASEAVVPDVLPVEKTGWIEWLIGLSALLFAVGLVAWQWRRRS